MTKKIDKLELAILSDVLASVASYILNSLLNFETHLNKTYKKVAGRVNLLRKTCAAAERIYRAMIMPAFTHCNLTTLS